MTFAQPAWFWALLLVPLLLAWLSRDVRRRKVRFSRFAAPGAWAAIAPDLDWNRRLRKGRFWVVALGFIFLALARPQWGAHEEVIHTTGLDILFVLDVSNSMEVEDVVPNRLKKAKHEIRSMVDRLAGDRVGLVAFAASSYLACPLTNDDGYFLDALEIQNPRMIQNQGTDIGTALETAYRALERGAEETSKDASVLSRVVILISDGEDHEDEATRAAKKLKESGIRLYVLGTGSEKGGPIPVRDDSGQLHGFKRDRKGEAIVSRFHPDALREIANTAGGKYWDITTTEGEVEEVVQELSGLSRGDQAERKFVVKEERFQFPLAIAILLLILELSFSLRARGGAAAAMVILVFLFSRPSRATDLPTYLENREGLKSFQGGKIDDAKRHFGNAQALDPANPALKYNEGVVQADGGDMQSAMRGLSEAALDALKSNDPGLAARSLYNLGGIQAKNQALDDAAKSYLSSIQLAHRAKDVELEADARKNLELLEQKRQQQKQNQQNQKQDQKQQQQKQDKQDQNRSQQNEPKDQKEKQDQQKNQNQNEQQQKPEFRSAKLSKEDAERVMSDLSNEEQQTQMKYKRQQGTSSVRQKDW